MLGRGGERRWLQRRRPPWQRRDPHRWTTGCTRRPSARLKATHAPAVSSRRPRDDLISSVNVGSWTCRGLWGQNPCASPRFRLTPCGARDAHENRHEIAAEATILSGERRGRVQCPLAPRPRNQRFSTGVVGAAGASEPTGSTAGLRLRVRAGDGCGGCSRSARSGWWQPGRWRNPGPLASAALSLRGPGPGVAATPRACRAPRPIPPPPSPACGSRLQTYAAGAGVRRPIR